MYFFRQLAVYVLLTVFATVSLLGTGLHLFQGCGHLHAPWHLCEAHFHAGHHHHHHDHHYAVQDSQKIGESHADCAICRFLAIPRALTPPPRIADCGTYFEPLFPAISLQPALETARPYGARAPPSPSSNA